MSDDRAMRIWTADERRIGTYTVFGHEPTPEELAEHFGWDPPPPGR